MVDFFLRFRVFKEELMLFFFFCFFSLRTWQNRCAVCTIIGFFFFNAPFFTPRLIFGDFFHWDLGDRLSRQAKEPALFKDYVVCSK